MRGRPQARQRAVSFFGFFLPNPLMRKRPNTAKAAITIRNSVMILTMDQRPNRAQSARSSARSSAPPTRFIPNRDSRPRFCP